MRESPRVQIYDMARWDIMPHKDYSGATFSVLVGDSYMPSRILHPTEVTEIIKQGYKTIDVPIEYEHDFSIDVVGALRDIAGLTVAGSRKYKLFPSQKFIKFDDTKQDPVAMDTIITGLNDMRRWISLIDLNKLRVPLDVQRFGHFDFAISGDAAAIAFSCIKGWTTGSTVDEAGLVTETQVPVVETDMVVRIKAAPDDRIPLSSVRQLILDLRSAGLRIGYFSYDLLVGSEDTKQILNKAGVAGDHFSVDKDTKAYLCFRDMVFEERWVCHPHPWVAFEMAEIEHNREKNKIDHPDRVTKVQIIDGQVKKHVVDGSKDCLDAIVASVYHAVMRASPVASVAEVREGLAGLKKGHMKREDWFMKTIVPDVSAEDRQELESAGDSVEEVRDALAGLKARRAMRQRGKGYGFF